MRIIPTTVILLLWTTKRLTEATLPDIATFFLPPPPPPPTEKVLVVHVPTASPSAPQPPSPPQQTSAQHQSDHFQNEFRLHQLEHSTFVSTNNGSGIERHDTYHLLQQGTPLHSPEESSSPSHNQNYFPPVPQGQEAALANNYVLPQQRSSSSYHQPVPLTFPPSSSIDSHSLPRIISLPPYPSQQLPQKSAFKTETDTTSSSSYSFTQGFRPSYGPPKTTKIVRHVSVFLAPQQDSHGQNRQKIRVQGQAEKHVNIIFIKNPDTSKSDVAEIELPPSPEQKTYVYVLNKANEGPGQVVVNTPEPPKYSSPDVFFIRYKNQQGQQQQQQGGGGAYGSPPHQPSSEYGAPSNQNFNYTLPSYSSVVTSSSLAKQNKSINVTQSSLEPKPTKNTLVAANKQLEEETHYHLHDLNYVISQQQQQLENKLQQVKLEHQQDNHNHKGLYTQIPRDNSNGIPQINKRKDGGDDEEEMASQQKREQDMRGIQVIAPNAKPVYSTVADIVGDVRLLVPNNINKTTHGNNSSFTGDNTKRNSSSNNTGTGDDDDDDDDVSVLTKRNLTSATSGVGDSEQEKGSTGDVSGRPDDFRPYKYAPALGYNYFGVIGYKAID